MSLASLGWFVVHALWIGAVAGGIAAMCLASLPDRLAPVRYALGYGALLMMVAAPLGPVLVTLDLFTPDARIELTNIVEGTIGFPRFVEWRGRLIRGAAIVWILVLAAHVVRVARESRRLRLMRRQGTCDAGPRLAGVVSELSVQLGVGTPVSIMRSSRADVPMVFGWRRSTILMPSHAASSLSPAQLRAVLLHEMAHVRRGDYAANLLQVAAEAVLWFHPAARWLSRRVRAEREYCCDDVAVRLGTDAADYARALARLEEARHDSRLAVAAASGTLLDRMQRVLGKPRPVLRASHAAAIFAVALLAAAAIVTAAMVVPPAVPLDARLRARMPGPPPPVQPPPGALRSRQPRP